MATAQALQALGVTCAELRDLLTGHEIFKSLVPPAPEAPTDADHLDRALQDAGRYLDEEVADFFDRQLDVCAQDDGTHGAIKTLPAVLGVVSIVQQHARQVKPQVRRRLLNVGARGAEFAGWLYRDAHRPDLALYWRDRAVEWAQEAGNWAMPGYILLKKSQSAWDDRDGLRMLTLAQAAQEGPWSLSSLVRAEVAQQEARGLAMTGEAPNLVARKLDSAWELYAEATASDREPDQLGRHYNENLLTLQTAICHCEAGQPLRCIALYDSLLGDDRFTYRDQGYFRSLLAGALAVAGEPDRATEIGQQALEVARQTSSERTMQELRRVCGLLESWQVRPTVRDFRAGVAASAS